MDTFERMVNETVHSGIAPLQQSYVGVFDGYGECPVAYCGSTALFTAATGVVEAYRAAVADTDTGMRLSLRNLAHGIRCMHQLQAAGRTTRWVSAEAYLALLTSDEAYASLQGVLDAEHCDAPERLVLAFDAASLAGRLVEVRQRLEEIRSLGLCVALTGVTADFALPLLADVRVDYVFFAPTFTALTTDRNKPGVFSAVVGLLHTMGVGVVAEGVVDDDQIRELTAVECFGFLPAADYSGEFLLPKGARDMADILRDEEGV